MKDMKAKFKVDDLIHYMESNKPQCGVVTGIITKQGKGDGIHDKFNIPEGKVEVSYAVDGHYYSIKEADTFPDIKSLKDSLFGDSEGRVNNILDAAKKRQAEIEGGNE